MSKESCSDSQPRLDATSASGNPPRCHIETHPALGEDLEVRITQMAPHHHRTVAWLMRETVQFTVCPQQRRIAKLLRSCEFEATEGLVVTASRLEAELGVVGAILFSARRRSLHVDTFLLGPRICGRGIERQLLILLGAIAQVRGLPRVDVTYVSNGQNDTALDFLAGLGATYRRTRGSRARFKFPSDYVATLGSDGARGKALLPNGKSRGD